MLLCAPWVTADVAAAPGLSDGARLAAARAALGAGDGARALDLVFEVLAANPGSTDAHVVAGLIYYRRDEPASALQHFERALALAGEEAEGGALSSLAFNRASCLFALGRFGRAETAFLQVAQVGAEPALAGLSWVNAAYAALEQRAPERAERYLRKVRARGLCDALSASCEDLESELEEVFAQVQVRALEQLEAGDYASARSALAVALAARPDDPDLNYHAGVAAFGAGDDDAAYRYLERAQRHQLGGQRAALAAAYTDRLAGGVRLGGRGWSLLASASVAYDDNVTLSSDSERVALLSGADASPGLGLLLDVGYADLLGAGLYGRVGYSVQQAVYTLSALRDWSSQDHLLQAQVEWMLTSSLRLGAGVYGALGLVGFEQLRARGLELGGQILTAYQWSRQHRLQLGLGISAGFLLASEFDYLAGQGQDVSLSYQWLYPRFRGLVSLYVRAQALGEQVLFGDALSDAEAQQLQCLGTVAIDPNGCLVQYRVPLSYDAVGAVATASYRIFEFLRPMLRVGFEVRQYRSPFQRELLGPDGGLASRALVLTQRDMRLRLLAGATWSVGDDLSFFAGYEYSKGASNVVGATYDYGDESFERHWIQGEVILTL